MKLFVKALLMIFLVTIPLSSAYGYNITFDGVVSSSDGTLTTNHLWASVWNFNSGNLDSARPDLFSSIESDFNAAVVAGSASGLYAKPGQTDLTYYLAVPDPHKYSSGSITINLLKDTNDFLGLYWGSIDKYNSITFSRGGIGFLTLTGEDVVGSSAKGNQYNPNSNIYVSFNDLPAFDSFTLTSTNRAFEVDNIAVGASPVSEPASMFLFGLGFLGISSLRLRKKKKRPSFLP